MKLITAIIKANKVDDVKNALSKINVTGITLSEVKALVVKKDTRKCIVELKLKFLFYLNLN